MRTTDSFFHKHFYLGCAMAAEPQHFQFLEGVKSYTKHVEDHIKGLEAEVLAWKKRCAVVLCVETAHACSE